LLAFLGLVSASFGNEADQPRSTLNFPAGAFPRLETRFAVEVRGNPWNFVENDVQVSIRGPAGQTVQLPAFFDGGTTWNARFSLPLPVRYAITAVTLNGR
jgi:hypothetical protein